MEKKMEKNFENAANEFAAYAKKTLNAWESEMAAGFSKKMSSLKNEDKDANWHVFALVTACAKAGISITQTVMEDFIEEWDYIPDLSSENDLQVVCNCVFNAINWTEEEFGAIVASVGPFVPQRRRNRPARRH